MQRLLGKKENKVLTSCGELDCLQQSAVKGAAQALHIMLHGVGGVAPDWWQHGQHPTKSLFPCADINAVVRDLGHINNVDALKIWKMMLEKWICKTGPAVTKVCQLDTALHFPAAFWVIIAPTDHPVMISIL